MYVTLNTFLNFVIFCVDFYLIQLTWQDCNEMTVFLSDMCVCINYPLYFELIYIINMQYKKLNDVEIDEDLLPVILQAHLLRNNHNKTSITSLKLTQAKSNKFSHDVTACISVPRIWSRSQVVE